MNETTRHEIENIDFIIKETQKRNEKIALYDLGNNLENLSENDTLKSVGFGSTFKVFAAHKKLLERVEETYIEALKSRRDYLITGNEKSQKRYETLLKKKDELMNFYEETKDLGTKVFESEMKVLAAKNLTSLFGLNK